MDTQYFFLVSSFSAGVSREKMILSHMVEENGLNKQRT